MSVPYRVARSGVSRLFSKIAANKKYQLALFSLTAGVTGYLGRELAKEPPDFPEPLPLLNTVPSVPKKVDINPSVKDPLDEVLAKVRTHTLDSSRNFDSMESDMSKRLESYSDNNEKVLENFRESSPLLANQVLLKDTLDNINHNLEAQSILLGELWSSLEKNLSSIVAIKLVDSQNNKILTDYQKQMASSSDYGDSEFFYAFIPTGEWWTKADRAAVLYEYKTFGRDLHEDFYPSTLRLVGETTMIDRMESQKLSKIEIRRAVEDYRKTYVSAPIRALIDAALVESAKVDTKTAQDTAKSTEKAATNMGALVEAVAPISRWAEQAKAREVYLATAIPQVKDLDGNVVAENVSPLAVTLAKEVAQAREKTDLINFEVDDTDFPSFDFLPVLPFVGRESVYDPNYSEPAFNPFNYKSIV